MDFFRRLSRQFAWIALVFICCISFGLMFWASRTDSAIDDELAHIPAGYGYIHNLDYRLNPEHPPLIKALAMLPVLFLNPVFPTNSAAWQKEVNGEWDMGTLFLYESGNNANAIIQTARIFPILITLLVVVLIYLLARKRMGEWWALLPSFLFALSPTILANGHYVTTDVGAAFGVVFSVYFFIRYSETPTTKNLWYAGLAFGAAQITKFSTPLLVPLYIFLVFVLWLREMIVHWNGTARDPLRQSSSEASTRFRRFFKSFCRGFWKLILIGAIGYIFIVYPVYFLFTVHYPIAKQVSDTISILTSFAGGPTPAGQLCKGVRCLADTDILMAKSPVFRPFAQYLLGILMVLQRVDGGNTIYFLGRVVSSGGWIYFPVLYLLKEPLPTLAIVLFAFALALWWTAKRAIAEPRNVFRNVIDYIGVNFAEFSMASFVVMYWGYSLHSTLNLGIRYMIPTFPFIYILAAGVWKRWVLRFDLSRMIGSPQPISAMARSIAKSAAKYVVLVALVAWLFFETIIAAPYFLSYFNEIGGGVWSGYHYSTDSNYDWGQDLLRLQVWVNANPQIDKIAVDYFGGGNPKYYLGDKEVNWSSSKGNSADQGIHWLAVSINTLELATQPLGPGQSRNASDTYAWLTALRPPKPGTGNVPTSDYRIGTSIFVYHLGD